MKDFRKFLFGLLLFSCATISGAATRTWEGDTSVNWNSRFNWSNNQLLGVNDNVRLGFFSNPIYQPTISTNPSCYSVTFGNIPTTPTTLTINNGNTLSVGSLWNDSIGIFQPTSGTVRFNGTVAAIITQGADNYFNNLTFATTRAVNITSPVDWKGELTVGGVNAKARPSLRRNLFIGSTDCKLYAIDPVTLDILWIYLADGSITSPLVSVYNTTYSEYQILFATSARTVYCLVDNMTSAAVRWFKTYPAGSNITCAPITDGIRVYFGSSDNNVYALNINDGSVAWALSYTTGADVTSSPAVANGSLYIGSMDGKIYELNATMGVYLRDFNTGSTVTTSMYVDSAGRPHAGNAAGQVFELSPLFVPVWTYAGVGQMNSIPYPNAVPATAYYCGSNNGSVQAINALTGAPLVGYFPYTVGSPIGTELSFYNKVIYAASNDEQVWALDAITGAVKTGWPEDIGSTGAPPSPILLRSIGKVLFIAANGRLVFKNLQ